MISQASKVKSSPKNKKVLLVEDDPMIVRMYQRKLKLVGFNLTTAFNGEEGLKALKNDRPDIVLLDIMMPKMNGLEMLKVMKADHIYKNLPVVMLTNFGDRSEDVEKSKALGADDYWVKANMKLGDIVEKIDVIIKNHSGH